MESNSKVNKLSDIYLGYVAGIIDGEGTIGLYKRNNRPSYSPIIRVTNTNEDVCPVIKDIIGCGSITIHTHTERGDACWSYTLNGPFMIESLLEQVADYLIIKKEQACLLLAYCKIRNDSSKRELVKEIYFELGRLNAHGKGKELFERAMKGR